MKMVMILEKILVRVNADSEIKEEFSECFSDRAELVFLDDINESDFKDATVILGEPTENELALTENLKLLQLTWAGADKFLKMKNFPKNIKLTTASGAFGEVISEYVIGGILVAYFFSNDPNIQSIFNAKISSYSSN